MTLIMKNVWVVTSDSTFFLFNRKDVMILEGDVFKLKLMVSFSNENPDFVDNFNSEHLMRVKNGITLLLNQVQKNKFLY